MAPTGLGRQTLARSHLPLTCNQLMNQVRTPVRISYCTLTESGSEIDPANGCARDHTVTTRGHALVLALLIRLQDLLYVVVGVHAD